MYAGEYKPFSRSLVIAFVFSELGSTRYMTGTSGMADREVPMCLDVVSSWSSFAQMAANLCIVTPIVRKSETRRTLLTTSRPKSSKTRTFQIGFPSESRMGATGANRAWACASSLSFVSTLSFKLSIRLREATACQDPPRAGIVFGKLTNLAIPQRLPTSCHDGCGWEVIL